MALTAQQQAIELISRAKNILVTTTEHATIDATAAVISVGLLLQKLNKTFDLIIPGFDPKSLPSFLTTALEIRPHVGALRAFHLRVKVKDVPLSELMYDVRDGQLDITLIPKQGSWTPQDVAFVNGDERYDLIIAVDAQDMASLGAIARENADFLYRTTILNIDCHSTNEHWGQINLVDLNAVSTTEVIYDWLTQWNAQMIDETLATALLTGMIARTKSFRTPNVTPKTLNASSQLITLGARRDLINQGLWRNHSISTLKLWGRALSRLEEDRELGLVWTTLSENDFLESGAGGAALDGIVDELIAYAPSAKLVAVVSQEKSEIRVSLHAQPPRSAAELARPFGGNGTRERATFPFHESTSLLEATQKIVERLKETLKATK